MAGGRENWDLPLKTIAASCPSSQHHARRQNGADRFQHLRGHMTDGVIELQLRALHHPPSIRVTAPDCFTGSIETIARSMFGIENISKAWFGYSFSYVAPSGKVDLLEDGRTLNATFGRSEYGRRFLEPKLRRYYGLTIEMRTLNRFTDVLEAITDALRAGNLVISPIGLNLMLHWYEYGLSGSSLTHGMVPTKLDYRRGTISMLETILGPSEIRIRDYEKCFASVYAEIGAFPLWYCRREPYGERPLTLEDIRQDLAACVAHLHSENPNEGLAGLHLAMTEIAEAFGRLKSPAKVPGLWSLGLDRYALQESLPHWRAAGLGTESALANLHALLTQAIAMWGAITGIMHSAVTEQDTSQLQELDWRCQAVVRLERQVADAIEGIYRASPEDAVGPRSSG